MLPVPARERDKDRGVDQRRVRGLRGVVRLRLREFVLHFTLLGAVHLAFGGALLNIHPISVPVAPQHFTRHFRRFDQATDRDHRGVRLQQTDRPLTARVGRVQVGQVSLGDRRERQRVGFLHLIPCRAVVLATVDQLMHDPARVGVVEQVNVVGMRQVRRVRFPPVVPP